MSKLTDAQIRAATYTGSILKLRDGNGLYVHVMPSGKYHRMDYRFDGKRRTLALGVYPDVSLKQARIALFAAKSLLADGIDPNYEKQRRKLVNDDDRFRSRAAEWLAIQDWSDDHRRTVESRLDNYLFPKIGDKSVKDISAPDILAVLRSILSRGNIETAHRVLTVSGQVMRYCVAVGSITTDPCRDLRDALPASTPEHFAAITDPIEFGKLLRAIDTYDNSFVIGLALQLLPHVFLRSKEFRGARWDELDIKNKLWTVPAERMKGRIKREHLVPLTKQSITIIDSLREYTGDNELLFPSPRKPHQPISDGTLNAALRYLGFDGTKHVAHGFRTSFSTMTHGSDKFNADLVEFQLAHVEQSKVKAAYDRGDYLKQRRKIMKWWSKRIDALKIKSA